jgi:hypothetical protein
LPCVNNISTQYLCYEVPAKIKEMGEIITCTVASSVNVGVDHLARWSTIEKIVYPVSKRDGGLHFIKMPRRIE